MKPFILLSFIYLVLGSCNSLNENEGEQAQSDFDAYISTLEQIPLPLTVNPKSPIPKISPNFDPTVFSNSISDGLNTP